MAMQCIEIQRYIAVLRCNVLKYRDIAVLRCNVLIYRDILQYCGAMYCDTEIYCSIAPYIRMIMETGDIAIFHSISGWQYRNDILQCKYKEALIYRSIADRGNTCNGR